MTAMDESNESLEEVQVISAPSVTVMKMKNVSQKVFGHFVWL